MENFCSYKESLRFKLASSSSSSFLGCLGFWWTGTGLVWQPTVKSCHSNTGEDGDCRWCNFLLLLVFSMSDNNSCLLRSRASLKLLMRVKKISIFLSSSSSSSKWCCCPDDMMLWRFSMGQIKYDLEFGRLDFIQGWSWNQSAMLTLSFLTWQTPPCVIQVRNLGLRHRGFYLLTSMGRPCDCI